MKLLFSSSDEEAVEQFARRLKETGIAYDVRYPYTVDTSKVACYPEVWIHKKSDFQLATMLLGSRGRVRA